MKAYISKWYEKGWRISESNFGGSTEVEMPDAEYSRLRQMQDSCDTLQKHLANLVLGKPA